MLEKIATLFKNKKFLYIISADKNYAFTNSDKDVLNNGTLYKADYISHSAIKSTTNEARSKVEITFALDNTFISELKKNNITKKISVRILEFYVENNVLITKPIFFGEVDDRTVNTNEVVISVAPISANISATANRYSYKTACNHTFCSSDCGVNLSEQTVKVTVLGYEQNKKVLQLSSVEALFKNGRAISINGERQMILSVDLTNQKVTLVNTLNVNLNDEISIIRGCDKKSSTCTTYGGNYLGEEFVPIRNIFTQGV